MILKIWNRCPNWELRKLWELVVERVSSTKKDKDDIEYGTEHETIII